MPVVWTLNYSTATDAQATVARHHLALLRDDPAVVRVEAWESPERPDRLTVRVTFRDRCSRPERAEIQALDQMHSDEARKYQAAMLIRLQRGEKLKKTWYQHILDDD